MKENSMTRLRTRGSRLLLVGLAVLAAPPGWARDPGFNQPGAVGGTAGPGAPGAGVRDPGINQPGAVGNRGAGGAPGAGRWDPGFNQPGVAGNVGGVARQTVRRY
ncbi:MAG: hypothetical protein J0L57_01395 [Burkholderiales bacterium]|nr:hypothetical protein [Burkholderiales bacterium]